MSMEPEAAQGWPDEPLTEAEARELHADRADCVAVWVMDHDDATREALLGPDAPADAVVDVVLETDDAFELYSYTHHGDGTRWVTYGEEAKGGDATTMAGTLAHYRLLAGESDL